MLRNKMNQLTSFFALLFTIHFIPSAFGSDEIIRLYRSIRAKSLGGTWVTDGTYADALFGNPALYGQTESPKVILPEISMGANAHIFSDLKNIKSIKGSGAQVISGVAPLVGHNIHADFSFLIAGFTPHFFSEKWGFGAGFLLNTQANVFPHFNTNIDSQTIVDAGPALGFSKKMLENDALAIGFNLRANYRIAANFRRNAFDFLADTTKGLTVKSLGSEGFGIDSDLGAIYHLPLRLSFTKISVAATLQNALATTYQTRNLKLVAKESGTPPPRNPRSMNVGFKFEWPDLWIFEDTTTAIEMTDMGKLNVLSSNYKRFHLGLETKPFRWLALRAGISQGYLTAGLGFGLGPFHLDVGTWGEELGAESGQYGDRRFGLRMALEI